MRVYGVGDQGSYITLEGFYEGLNFSFFFFFGGGGSCHGLSMIRSGCVVSVILRGLIVTLSTPYTPTNPIAAWNSAGRRLASGPAKLEAPPKRPTDQQTRNVVPSL